MSVNGKFDGITRADLLCEADRFSILGAEGLVTDVRGALDNWLEHAKVAGINEVTSEEIARDFLPW